MYIYLFCLIVHGEVGARSPVEPCSGVALGYVDAFASMHFIQFARKFIIKVVRVLCSPFSLVGVEYRINEDTYLICDHKETWDIKPIEVRKVWIWGGNAMIVRLHEQLTDFLVWLFSGSETNLSQGYGINE